MFPSSSATSNYQLPFPCNTNQTLLLEKSFTNTTHRLGHENPNSVSHDHHTHQYCPPYSQYSDDHHLQAPNFLEHDGMLLSYLLSQQQLLVGNSSTLALEGTEISVAASNSNKEKEASKGSSSKTKKTTINGEGKKAKVPRKRSSGKKDRHSKIYTAQGPRDRRMRLSLQIARKFFDLQDMLGFDKASKTIEWLLTKSKTAIKEVKQHFNISPVFSSTNAPTTSTATAKMNSSTNSESTSEVASKIMESSTGTAANGDASTGMGKEKKSRRLCVVARESRAEARARARERTREKMMKIRGFDHHQKLTNQSPDHQALPNPNDDVGGGHYLWSSNCPNDQLYERRMLMNSMMMSINHHDQKIMGSTDPSGANFEDCDFPGFPGHWGGINNTKNITGNVLQVDQNPSRSTMVSYPQEQKPSSVFMSTSSMQDQNPSSSFVPTLIAGDQNHTSSNFGTNFNIISQSQFLGN